MEVTEIVRALQLIPHPEGGYYCETYRSQEECELPRGLRSVSTGIYFLLGVDDRSRFHVIRSDEMWHHYDGLPLEIHEITADGRYKVTLLGKDLSQGQTPQHLVPKGHIFGSKIASTSPMSVQRELHPPVDYALVGCTVAPGFDFNDFSLFETDELLQKFPHFQGQIHKFFNQYLI